MALLECLPARLFMRATQFQPACGWISLQPHFADGALLPCQLQTDLMAAGCVISRAQIQSHVLTSTIRLTHVLQRLIDDLLQCQAAPSSPGGFVTHFA